MNKNDSIYLLALTGLFIALSYIGTMFNIPFAIGGAKTMIHFGNIFALLGALVIGGKRGGFAASIGMGTFDLLNGWVPYAPSTVILKFFIALITGSVFAKTQKTRWSLLQRVLISTSAGMLFNIIFSPIASYLTTQFIIGTPADVSMILAKWQSITVFINAIIAITFATVLYLGLRPVIERNAHLKSADGK